MNTYRCDFTDLTTNFGVEHRARVVMKEDHKGMGGRVGEVTITSAVKMIDFERGIIVTQNSIYLFDVKK